MLANSLAMAMCCFCIPYCTGIAMLLVIRFLSGFFAGGIDTGANTIVPTIWNSKEGQSFMQAMYLAYTLGGIFSPLATKPFMAQSYDMDVTTHLIKDEHDTRNVDSKNKLENSLNGANAGNNTHVHFDTTGNETTIVYLVARQTTEKITNFTYKVVPDAMTELGYTDMENITETQGKNEFGESNIKYAFIIAGFIVLSSAIPYIIMTVLGNFDQRAQKDDGSDNPEAENLKGDHVAHDRHVTEANSANAIKGTKLWVILAFVAGINFVYSAIEDCVGDFLTTYCLFHLHWTKSDSVLLMSLYWVTSCSGGLAGIFVIKLLGPAKLLTLAFCVWNISFIISVIGNVTLLSTLTWVGFLGAGCAMVLVIPAIISWTNENVCEISGKVSSLIMISSGVGIAANPKFIGYMMETYSYGNFVYVLTCETFLCSLLFIGAIAAFSCCHDNAEEKGDMHEKG